MPMNGVNGSSPSLSLSRFLTACFRKLHQGDESAFYCQMFTSAAFSLAASAKRTREAKLAFDPFAYQFNLTDLHPALGEPFSYFAQASWIVFSPGLRAGVPCSSSDVPALSSAKETTVNERVITIE